VTDRPAKVLVEGYVRAILVHAPSKYATFLVTYKEIWARLSPSRMLSGLVRSGQLDFRLRTKLLISFVFLTAGLTSLTLLIVRRNAQEQAQHQIERDAQNATLTFQAVQRQEQTALSRKADLLASLAYMRDGDATAIQDASEDPWQSGDCNLFVLADKNGKIVDFHSTNPSFPLSAAQSMLYRSVKGKTASAWWVSETGLYQVVLQPFYEGEPGKKDLLGMVVVGHLIDQRAAADLGRMTTSDVVFRYGGKVAVSTFLPHQEMEFARQIQGRPTTAQISLGADHYYASSVKLSPDLDLIVLKSYHEAAAYLQRLNHILLAVGLLAIFTGTALIFLISDTVTRPLASLVNGVHALERGDLTYPLDSSSHDEFAQLMRAFDAMRVTLQSNQTQREQLENQLRQAQKMEALGRMAGGVAHDFNNLLTVIQGHSDLILDRLQPGDALYRNSQQIRKTADRAASLTRQMLAFSRMQVLQPKVLDLNELVADMGKLLRRLIREDIEFSLRLGESLARVKADPGQLEQVLLNLTVNASDAMPLGGKLTIGTHNLIVDRDFAQSHPSVEQGAYVVMSVSDTGHGMDTVTKARIFEPFFTTKAPGKGTGLGLATVYGVVKQSGGFIWIESSPENGSRFEIYLPQTLEQVEPVRTVTEAMKPAFSGKTVLVVEDEREVRELACEFLKAAGYSVLTAKDGLEALETAERLGKLIHIVVTDIVMPNMRGPELAKRLKALLPQVKIVYMTGYLEQNYANDDLLRDANFVQKPFSRHSIVTEVGKALDNVGQPSRPVKAGVPA
jgi:signal transduction histidine kinase/ActR/RegA family two-component response regulator